MQTYYRNVARRHFPTLPYRLCKLGEFLLGEAFLWIWQIVKECEKYDERNYGRRIEKNDG